MRWIIVYRRDGESLLRLVDLLFHSEGLALQYANAILKVKWFAVRSVICEGA